MLRFLSILALAAMGAPAADYADLFNHKNLDGWEIIGETSPAALCAALGERFPPGEGTRAYASRGCG